jgi:predicted RNA methylase
MPYNFIKKYNPEDVTVYMDCESGMKYVMHENRRLYFKRKWTDMRIKYGYNSLRIEQDERSPHRYETPNFNVQKGNTVVDAGTAEGNFALSVVEKAKKLYLVEVDEEWIEALNLTFAPWKEKVEIINKYVSDNDDNGCIRLDTFFKNKQVDFIKADIEGAETNLVRGSKNILSSNRSMRTILCTYHKHNDAKELNNMLTELGFKTQFSERHMIFTDSERFNPPYLRKGLIRAFR